MKKSTSRKSVLAPQLSIGLDLGSEVAVACLLDRSGTVVNHVNVGMTPAEMRVLLEGKPRSAVLMEACGVSGWVARLVEELGHDVVVCNPRRLKLIAQTSLKTDELDAEVLGRLGRLWQLDPKLVQATTVRARETQLKRSELAARDQLVGCRTKLISTVRSILRSDALSVPRGDADHFARNLAKLELPDDVRAVVEPLRVAIASLTEQVKAVEARIRKFSEELPIVGKLMAIGGVGLLTAVAYALTIEDASRFERSRDVGAYLGLVPRLYQSSQVERRGRCTKAGDARMRRLLVQAALCLLRSKKRSALQDWGLKLAERVGRKKAIVALARKLAVVMHRIWVTGEEYRPYPALEVKPNAA